MAVNQSKFKLKNLRKKVWGDFNNGSTNFTKLGKKHGVSRQLISRWHAEWTNENFKSDKHEDIVQVIAETKSVVTKAKINKALVGIDLLKNNIPDTLNKLRKNIERAAEKEKDPSKISAAFKDLAQFVMKAEDGEDNKSKTNNFFWENFQLHQTVNQLNNGQAQKLSPSGDQEE